MEVLYLLIPLAVVLAGIIVWFFLWAIRSGQFDDLEGPAWRILMDDDEPGHGTPRGTEPQHPRHQDHAGEDERCRDPTPCSAEGRSQRRE